jgi:hypothetical protein
MAVMAKGDCSPVPSVVKPAAMEPAAMESAAMEPAAAVTATPVPSVGEVRREEYSCEQ